VKRPRKAEVRRKTAETDISLAINLDGSGKYDVNTSIPFMDHMLSLFSKHSLVDLRIRAKGDTDIDQHHTVEDIGIVLGEAIKKALGDKKSIFRYGNFLLPMDEALSYVALDLSGRPFTAFEVTFSGMPGSKGKNFDYSLIEEFFRAVSSSSGMNLHIKSHAGRNNHHIAESVFKGFAKAFRQAVEPDKRSVGIPSTKKML
jgi:imidazoleglycerol-phosphate dehydratase